MLYAIWLLIVRQNIAQNTEKQIVGRDNAGIEVTFSVLKNGMQPSLWAIRTHSKNGSPATLPPSALRRRRDVAFRSLAVVRLCALLHRTVTNVVCKVHPEDAAR